jgi:hypothetical protein
MTMLINIDKEARADAIGEEVDVQPPSQSDTSVAGK